MRAALRVAATTLALLLVAPAARAQPPVDAEPPQPAVEQGAPEDAEPAATEDAPPVDAATGDADGEDRPESGGDAGQGNDDAAEPVEGEDDEPRRSFEPDAMGGGNPASGALGVLTLVSLIGVVTGVGTWVERDDTLAACQRFEAMGDRGCVNYGSIQDTRDVGIGLTIGFGTAALAGTIAWIVVATQSPSSAPPPEITLQCAPGALSFSCAGTF